MKLVANRFNQTHLSDLLPKLSETVKVDRVLAAIAYGDNSFLSKQKLSKCQILAYIDFIRHRSYVKLLTIKTYALAQGLIEDL